MADHPYKIVFQHHFSVGDEVIAITDIGKDFVCVEEVRKNGHEDTHMKGVLAVADDGGITWEEGEDMFVQYHSQQLADGIRQYLIDNGFPVY